MILKNMEKFIDHTLVIEHTPDYPSGKRYLSEEVSIPEIIKRAPFLDGDEIKALKAYPEKFFLNSGMAQSMSKESLIFWAECFLVGAFSESLQNSLYSKRYELHPNFKAYCAMYLNKDEYNYAPWSIDICVVKDKMCGWLIKKYGVVEGLRSFEPNYKQVIKRCNTRK